MLLKVLLCFSSQKYLFLKDKFIGFIGLYFNFNFMKVLSIPVYIKLSSAWLNYRNFNKILEQKSEKKSHF